jgi:hypothetical protein
MVSSILLGCMDAVWLIGDSVFLLASAGDLLHQGTHVEYLCPTALHIGVFSRLGVVERRVYLHVDTWRLPGTKIV